MVREGPPGGRKRKELIATTAMGERDPGGKSSQGPFGALQTGGR